MTEVKSNRIPKPPRAAIPWPKKRRGGEILNRLHRLRPIVVGTRPVHLAELVEDGLKPFVVTEPGVPDIVPTIDVPAVEAEVAVIRAYMTEILKAAPPADQIHPIPAPNVNLVPAWRNSVDTIAIAAGQLLECTKEAGRLADAFRGLAGLMLKPRSQGRSGAIAVVDPAFVLVRRVVLYRHQEGMPIESGWKVMPLPGRLKGSRHTDDECRPTSDTAVLLCEVALAFGIDVRHVTLRGLLVRYLAELAREKRAPQLGDGTVIEFSD